MGESDRATAKEFPKVKLQISSEDWLKVYFESNVSVSVVYIWNAWQIR